jgi:hypothetical protein
MEQPQRRTRLDVQLRQDLALDQDQHVDQELHLDAFETHFRRSPRRNRFLRRTVAAISAK